MIKIDSENTIHISRGDACNINLTANEGKYKFEAGDIIKLRIYNKNGYDEPCLLEKNVEVELEATDINIPIEAEDTSFSPESDKKMTYWYDISLNETTTIIGFDEDGAKKIIVYPAKIGGEE